MGIGARDLDRDGWVDIAMVHPQTNGLSLTFGADGGQFGTWLRYTTTAPSGLTVGDFNEDGILDVATFNTNARTTWLFRGRCR